MASFRSAALQAAALALTLSPIFEVGGCAFGGIADYEVASCDPNVADLDADVCNRLNTVAGECEVYQCDRARARCVRRARDFDRDGDPAVECGGKDCNDRSRAVASTAIETCDGVDNDCDGAIDEGVFASHGPPVELFKTEVDALDPAFGMPSGGEAYAASDPALDGTIAYVATTPGGACVKTAPAASRAESPACTFLASELDLAPRHPLARSFGVGTGVVFAATKLCPDGALAYRYAGTSQPPLSTGCNVAPAANGATLPNLEYFRDGALAVAAFYEERSPDLASSAGCTALENAPAPLVALGIAAPTTAMPSLDAKNALVLSTTTRSRSRPALARLDVDAPGLGGIFLASPDGDGVSVWSLFEKVDGTAVQLAAAPEKAVVPNLERGRSAGLGLARVDGGYRAAVVSAIGCTDVAIRVAFGAVTVSGAAPAVTFTPAIDVSTGSGGRFAPVVHWVTAQRPYWLVAWIEAGGTAMARRYDSAGAPIDDAFPLVEGASVIDASSNGRLSYFAPSASVNASAFQAALLGCGGQP